MARTRKSVLGENPFAAGGEPSAQGTTANGERTLSNPPADSAVPDREKPPKKAAPKKPAAKKPAAKKPAAKKPAAKKPAAKKPAAKKPAAKKPAAKKPAAKKPAAKKPAAKKPAAETAVVESPPAEKEQTSEAPEISELEERDASHANDERQRFEKQRIAEEIRRIESRPDVEPPPQDSSAPPSPDSPQEAGVFETARGLLSSDYYLRQWGRLGTRNRSAEVDDFGHDLKYDARFQPVLDLLYDRYFRVETEGIEHVPSEGRALIVANHAGTFPYDGVMLKTVVRREHPAARNVRWLTEDHLFYMPFVGSFLNRMGAVRACQENAERLLRHERLVAVFPEGAKGMGRLYRNRHKLQRFGRGGFVRLCLRTQTPIVPCVIIGAEESMPLLFRIEYLANVLGIPYIPVTPTFPMLGPLGVVPAPTKWQFVFGEPVSFERYGPDAADDHVLVRRLTERVRATMQGMIEQAAASRRSSWFG